MACVVAAWRPVLVAAVTLAVYANSFGGQFFFDDFPVLTSAVVRDPAHEWLHFFTLQMHRPLAFATFAANRALGRDNPWGYHAVNVAVHVCAALVLYDLARRTMRLPTIPDRYRNRADNLALAIAVLWAVHPLQTQSVTYLVQRMESMMGLGYLLTLYGLLRGATSERPKVRRAWYGMAVAACWAAMASKEVAVTAPVAALLYDRCFLSGTFASAIRARWRLYLLLLTSWVFLVPSLPLLSVQPASSDSDSAGLTIRGLTPWEYAQSQPGAICHYLRLTAWPYPQCLDPRWPVARTPAEIVPPALVVAALLAATAWALWWRPPLGFLGAAFFLILAPTSSIMPIRDLMFEHRMYLPLAAVAALVVLAGDAVLSRLGAGRRVRVLLTMAAVVAFGARTVVRNEVYRDDVAMWSDVAGQQPLNPRAQLQLGEALLKAGRHAEAVTAYRRALAFDPADDPTFDYNIPLQAGCHFGLGEALLALGDERGALAEFAVAVQLDPLASMYHKAFRAAAARAGTAPEADGVKTITK